MRYIALDVGSRRTGVSVYDDAYGIPLVLDTLEHFSKQELSEKVLKISNERGIDDIIIGLPLLPSGNEGAQSKFVRTVGSALEKANKHIYYLDERYSTPTSLPIDGDAAAACDLMRMFIKRRG